MPDRPNEGINHRDSWQSTIVCLVRTFRHLRAIHLWHEAGFCMGLSIVLCLIVDVRGEEWIACSTIGCRKFWRIRP